MKRIHSGRFVKLVQFLALLGLILLLAAEAPAQPRGKPPREEEEEPAKVKPKITLRVDDDTVTGKASAATDLRREAEQAKHAVVRELFKALAVPHDRVTFPATNRTDEVALLPFFVDLKQGTDDLELEPLDGKKPFKVGRRQVAKVEHYEPLAIRLVNEFLAVKDAIPRLERLQEAEKALAEVVRFHESARQRGLRKGRVGWDDVEKQLRGRLLEVRVEQLDGLIQEKKWFAAQELAEQLSEIYPGQPRFLASLLRLRVQQVEEALKDDRLDAYVAARRTLDDLQRQFPQAHEEEPVQRLRLRLKQKAETLLTAVAALPAEKQQDQLRAVENIWPELPGLQKYLEKSKGWRILYVGVRHLPEYLSPATAFVDAEKLALDLLFESLVRLTPDPVVGQRFQPQLSASKPDQFLLGRQFELVRDAYWYRDTGTGPPIKEPVLAADVSRTVLAHQKWPAHTAEWRDLLGGAQIEGDQHTVRLTLQQGYFDPLALMTFRILPARLVQKPDDPLFARNPVGSGPYQFAGQMKGRDDRTFTRFLLNPAYSQRIGKEPAIREIRFWKLGQPESIRQDLAGLPLHVVYDLPATQIEEVKSQGGGVNHRFVNLKNRRVWFLAVNHRDKDVRSEDLRRAIGLAIDRERILDDAFRPRAIALADGIRTKEASNQPDRSIHRALTGPYPPNTWACKEGDLLSLHRPDDARARAKAASLAGARVTLSYPNDLHPGVPRACELIRDQVRDATGIEIAFRPMPWRQLRDAVENQHDYELAYYCWDFADDRFALGPLFDPAGAMPGGRNFLGVDDPELTDLFRRARDRRQFSQLQQLTHLIHQHVNQKLPLIPLWQLDTCLVLRNDLLTPPSSQLDPLRLFGQVEEWGWGK